MKLVALSAVALLAGGVTVCSAAEVDKNSLPKYEFPSAQLGDYSLKLDTDAPKPLNSPDSGALTPLKQDSIQPFVGFSLSRPITDDFWKIGR